MIASIGSPWLWGIFLAGILLLLLLDLGVFHRRSHSVGLREAVAWSVVWVALSLSFNAWILFHFGRDPALEFLTGYVIEKALSVDNIFVFLVIFRYFAVPAAYQHRVLFWGIIGAIVLRGIFIGLGTALVANFHWIFFVFGAFLLLTGGRILFHKEAEVHPERNPVVRFFRRFVPISSDYDGQHFITRVDGRRVATPLLLVVVVVEASDLVFAVDSIPAIFAVTVDPFIVFSSNILAILGLRAMYFVLAGMMHRFTHLKTGLGLVLVFVGLKMLIADFYKVPTGVSLIVITTVLAGSVLISLFLPSEEPPGDPPATGGANPGGGAGPTWADGSKSTGVE